VDGDELPQIKVYFVMRLTCTRRRRISLENENSPSLSAFYNEFKVELNLSDSHLRSFFWVIPRRLNFICQRFGTLWLFHPHSRCWGIYTGRGVWFKNIFEPHLFLYKYPNNRNPVILLTYTAYEDGIGVFRNFGT
jgi:hypothetical protein